MYQLVLVPTSQLQLASTYHLLAGGRWCSIVNKINCFISNLNINSRNNVNICGGNIVSRIDPINISFINIDSNLFTTISIKNSCNTSN